MPKKRRFVCIGGGNAMPRSVLSQLKREPVSISAICAMLDSGGSAGRLRKDYQINSPGDIRRALLALANTSPIVENLFNFRFEGGDLKGHNFANLFITALELSTNSYEETIKEIRKLLNIEHEVLPATLDRSEVCAILENGKKIIGETNIDIPKHEGSLKIKKVFLEPEAKAYPLALKAIEKADMIVIGPGDLYSSLAQVLLTKGMSQSINRSKAKKVYISNLMTKHGETDDYSVSDFTQKIEEMIEGSIDYVLYHNLKISSKRVGEYRKKSPELLEPVLAVDCENDKFIGMDLINSRGDIIHDAKKLVKALMSL
ncbi:MAG: gluconeogenesis factor YvcK family protein [Minisyncoccales bacterium]|jgi:uncharacterized cofD-like protein